MISLFKLVQKKHLENLVAAIPKDLPTALYRAAYAEAIKLSKEFNIDSIGKALQEMMDEDIIQTMLLLAIRKTYKGDAAKKAEEIMDNQDDINSVMGAINGQGKDMEEDEGEGDSGDTSPPQSVQP